MLAQCSGLVILSLGSLIEWGVKNAHRLIQAHIYELEWRLGDVLNTFPDKSLSCFELGYSPCVPLVERISQKFRINTCSCLSLLDVLQWSL